MKRPLSHSFQDPGKPRCGKISSFAITVGTALVVLESPQANHLLDLVADDPERSLSENGRNLGNQELHNFVMGADLA